jgi:aspartyl-tRNA(Asn)/glutamyl-tRNA(Gln) amidotransferase subunit A
MNPTDTTLIELRDAIAARSLSSAEATRAYLDRIQAFNDGDDGLHAYHEVYAERAMQRAAAVDQGEVAGPLAGVPIAIKDLLCTDYGHTTCSSKMLENFRAPYTATAVKKLEDAGAVVLGKTNMDEFAMGSSTENSAFVTTRNPWDTDRVPGGSSGGSAAAMAADLCAASIGSDTGGSIRQPAALCGVVGMKPTYGRVSRYGLIAFASSLDQIGPFTRTVADTALLLKVMMGHDPLDSTSANVPVPDDIEDVDEAPKGLRIGIAKEYLSDANDPAVAAATERAIEVYKGFGAEIVQVELPYTEYGIPVYYIVATAEASSNLARYDGVHYGHRTSEPGDLIDLYCRSRAEGFGDEVKRRIMLGTYALSSGYYDAYYNRALKVRRLIKDDLDKAFEACDAILCPTTTAPAFKIGEKADDPLAMYLNDVYTVNCNLAGNAGISLPGGTATVDGKELPVGVQLLGPAFDESRLLKIARVFEAATDHHTKRPKL